MTVNFRVLLRAANALDCTLDDLLQPEITEPTKTVMEAREPEQVRRLGLKSKNLQPNGKRSEKNC